MQVACESNLHFFVFVHAQKKHHVSQRSACQYCKSIQV